MKYIGLIAALAIMNALSGQCPFTVTINNTGNNCLGSASFHITTTDNLTKIVWRNGNDALATITPVFTTYSGLTVAGGNGLGSALNQVSTPWKIFVDKNGNVYIADADNFRVEKWAPGATAGIVVAGGNGEGPADNQMTPYGIHVNDNGDIFVLDEQNSRVQKWSPGATTGVTVAGGNGAGQAANQFRFPTSMFIDANGNIYVNDFNNHRIQKWAPGATTGITVAGGNGAGSAANQLNYPFDVFVDASGIYIADAENYRVQKWAHGAVTGVTIAGGNGIGSAANQFNGIAGIFVDHDGNLYVADASNHRIQKWAPGATSGTTVAGGNGQGFAVNQLSFPNDVFVDDKGNIYVADFYNRRIQKWGSHYTIDLDYLPTTPGVYTAEVTNGDGCTVITNAITVYPVITPSVNIISPATAACAGTSVSFTATATNGGNNPVFQWKVNGINAGTNSASFTSNSLPNNARVSCELTSNAPCTTTPTVSSNNISVTIYPAIDPSVQIAVGATTICAGTAVTFTASPANSPTPVFQWQVNGSNAGTNSPSFTTSNLADGDIVSCILTNTGSCSSISTVTSNSIKINVSTIIPSVNITASNTKICSGTPVNFTAASVNAGTNPEYQWQVNGIIKGSNSPVFTGNSFLDGDIISCKIISDAGCSSSSNSMALTVNPLPVVTSAQTVSITPGQSVTVIPSIEGNIATYMWTPSNGLSDATTRNPVASPTKSTNYNLAVTTVDGCKATGNFPVKVFTKISIPNSFTPGGNRKNDIFYILGEKEGCRINNFSIFNRWGEKIFHIRAGIPNDPVYGWDGKFKGVDVSPGIYIYTITLALADGSLEHYKGTVILIR